MQLVLDQALKYKTVGAKQDGDNDRWQYVWDNIQQIIPRSHVDEIVSRKVDEVAQAVQGKRVGYAWSGGKDSQALRVVMELAGINQCVMGMTKGLEYPEFLAWATDNMPPELDIVYTEQDLPWLKEHQDMLFPQDSATASKWFSSIQHRAQKIFNKRYGFSMIILGRRLADKNYCGPAGLYEANGITRYSPIYNWTHEEVLAVCFYYNVSMPPIYDWVNGWVVGSGAWAARQWTRTTQNGWKEVYSIDRTIVIEAAQYIDSAKDFLDRL